MKMRSVILWVSIAAFAAGSMYGQPLLFYTEGRLDEIKGMRRVVVVAPSAGERAAVEKQLNGKHGLRIVRGGSRQFQLNYTCLPSPGSSPEEEAIVDIKVYIPDKDPIPIVWKRKESIATCNNAAARTSLVKEFLRDFGSLSRRN